MLSPLNDVNDWTDEQREYYNNIANVCTSKLITAMRMKVPAKEVKSNYSRSKGNSIYLELQIVSSGRQIDFFPLNLAENAKRNGRLMSSKQTNETSSVGRADARRRGSGRRGETIIWQRAQQRRNAARGTAAGNETK